MLTHRTLTSAGLAIATAAALAASPVAHAHPDGAAPYHTRSGSTVALAGDLRSPDARDAARDAAGGPLQDLRSPDTRDAATRGAIVQRPIPAPRIVRASSGGFDWGDAGIGAGGTLGLVLVVTGAGAVLTRRRSAQRIGIAA